MMGKHTEDNRQSASSNECSSCSSLWQSFILSGMANVLPAIIYMFMLANIYIRMCIYIYIDIYIYMCVCWHACIHSIT